MNNISTRIRNSIIIFILMLTGILLGFFHAKSLGVSLEEERVHIVAINSEDDIANMGGSFYNNICRLESDIIVENHASLASSDFPFVGVFDGQGYTITFKGDISQSLFGYIGYGGVVKNLNIDVSSCNFDSQISAILALENLGTIVNCRIIADNINLSRHGMYASVVAQNKGVIKNVYTKVNFVNMNTESSLTSSQSVIGGIAAYNYGLITSSICEINYENFDETKKDNVFNGSTINTCIGAIYGMNMQGDVDNCAAIIDSNAYLSDNKNKEVLFVTNEQPYKVFNEDYLFTTLGFDSKRWTYRNDMFTLIKGEDNEYIN